MSESQPRCEVCGEPMPAGEEMFNFHGFSGPCPKPPLIKRRPTPESNTPLRVAIEGEELVVRIGLDTLQMACENCPLFYDDETRDYPPYVTVKSREQLAKDVCRALLKEQEDGTTPLHLVFDEAFESARDDGSEAFDDGPLGGANGN